jgi:nicotinamide mononucleotide transporter
MAIPIRDEAVQPPFTGTSSEKIEAVKVLGGSVLLTLGYVFIAKQLDTTTTQLEMWSLVFSFACVWLARTENIHSMTTGITSVILMGVFLLQIDLVGQGWLQFVFYVPVQLYGWWAWSRGGEGKTELPVSKLSKLKWLLVAVFFLVSWRFFNWVFGTIYDDPSYLLWDTSIVAASVLAQVLMVRKKVECWFFWTGPVNISAIFLYWVIEVPAFSFLYSIFLINAIAGWWQWNSQRPKILQ